MSNIPPYQDIARLSTNLCLSERTVENWVKQGLLPPPKNKGGKRLWKWTEVERYLDGSEGQGLNQEIEEIRNETRRQASRAG
jgi:DNA-binding transcriptional MerR regulator